MHRCFEWLEPSRAEGVHELLVELLGECTCASPDATVTALYSAENAKAAERWSA